MQSNLSSEICEMMEEKRYDKMRENIDFLEELNDDKEKKIEIPFEIYFKNIPFCRKYLIFEKEKVNFFFYS